jgi:hypothetical protein
MVQAETKVSFMAPHDVAESRLHRAMAYFDDVRWLASDAMTRNSILDNGQWLINRHLDVINASLYSGR